MFENNIVERRLMKRKAMMDELEKAKEENNTWKINQLESKLYEFNKRHYPNISWDSNSKGTYKKENKEETK